jgi:hypothetical protein
MRSTKRTERLAAVQKQMSRVEEWRRLGLAHRQRDLERERIEIVAALNDDGALQGLFVDSMARRLTRLGAEQQRVASAHDVQERVVREQTVREKCAERLLDRQLDAAAREEEKRALDQIVDQVAARPQGSGKPVG